MTSQEIRNTFLDFFRSKQHRIVPSAPLVIKDDPTLMFTNAGMNQFKNIFLGNDEASDKKVANTQKCLRVSGKHNDLEEVGVDTYHHTMFEMLGNWSFGDYFKKEAIAWAWELLTDRYKLPVDRLYVTVFKGDEEDGLEGDEEAFEMWKGYVEENRIIRAGKKDNFWEMGEIGPCGPCSEIHIDLRDESARKNKDGRELVNQDHPLVVEIWNLVFIAFNRMADRSLQQLPERHVDTGMGLERLCMAMQGVTSNYDTDLFQPLIRKVESLSGLAYQRSASKRDVAFRVIVDHVRAVAFSIADGQLPSNSGAGYVIRRILRRAIRYGYSFLDRKEAFIHELIPVLVEQMGEAFPELEKQQELIGKVIREEEENFLRTLAKGIQMIEQQVSKEIDGDFAFELYDTYGFPIDLTRLIADEKGWKLDMESFQQRLQEQKTRSKKAGKIEVGDWVVLTKDEVEEFVGYDRTETGVAIMRYREVNTKGKKAYQLVFNLTPFYPEGGGQVGDTGYIDSAKERIYITDTRKENNLIVHFSDKLPAHPGEEFHAVVDENKRRLTERNHTATHLLHHALREVLGTHVEQKGSLVHPDYLRFDFSHFQKVEKGQLEEIEQKVNEKIRQGVTLEEKRMVPIDEARSMGAMALFGEKYGDVVRVIKFGESVELCGGTHVPSTASIGAFRIISESSVAAGIRRIEAVTSEKADEYLSNKLSLLEELEGMLKNPKDIKLALKQLQEQNTQLNKQLEELKRERTVQIRQQLVSRVKEVKGAHLLAEQVDMDPESIKDLAFQLKSQFDDLLMVIGSVNNGKALLSVMVSDKLVNERKMNAAEIVRDLAKDIQGGGGGQAFFATAGGKNPEGLGKAIGRVADFVVPL